MHLIRHCIFLPPEKSIFELLITLLSAIGPFLWPTTVIIIAVIFRKQLAALLSRIQFGKFPGIELQFGKELEQIEANTDQTKKTPDTIHSDFADNSTAEYRDGVRK